MIAEATAFRGHLELEAAPRPGGRTVLARQSFRAPFHISKPYWEGGVLQVRVVNPTAGILGGDRLELDVRVQTGASLLLTTPAATRAFAMRAGASASCRQSFAVAPGAWLEYAPEPLFPHAGSDYEQSTRIETAEGAELYWVDALAPGRVGRGECWAWGRLRMGLDLVHGGEPVLVERLDASGPELAARAAFFGQPEAWFATAVVISPRLDGGEPLWARVRALHREGCWVGATRLRRGGWVIRAVAPGALALRGLLGGLRGAFSEGLPGLRSDLRRL
ncbi:MAG TPA: urease accessory protein UreD [Opitutaceae bacterium]|nr:urease accessory protein UreD [Opitutaceae bacterium]